MIRIPVFSLLIPAIFFSQDTISILIYNILAYSSNDANKNRYLDIREVVKYSKPDVAMFCEIVNTSAPQFLLDSSFNAAMVGTYTRSAFYDGPHTDNILFFKPSKISLLSQKQIPTSLRDISQYVLYKKTPQGDTVKIFLHMAHLKAGSTPQDETQRNSEVNAFCSSISSIPSTAAVVFAGDMNLKSDIEAAWNTITSGSLCPHTFYDPAAQIGMWYNNPIFAPYHTQSTRSSAFPGCCGASTGGLDDRFDFILINQTIKNGNGKIKYLPGSYKTIGNDGQHFNLSVMEAPTNTSVPLNVNTALFNISDHLPVMLKLTLNMNPIGLHENRAPDNCIPTLLSQQNQPLLIYSACDISGTIVFYDLTGRKLNEEFIDLEHGKIQNLKTNFHDNGIYLVKISTRNKNYFFKIIH